MCMLDISLQNVWFPWLPGFNSHILVDNFVNANWTTPKATNRFYLKNTGMLGTHNVYIFMEVSPHKFLLRGAGVLVGPQDDSSSFDFVSCDQYLKATHFK